MAASSAQTDAAVFASLSRPYATAEDGDAANVSRNAAYRFIQRKTAAASCAHELPAPPRISTAARAVGSVPVPPCPARVGPDVRLLLGVHSAPDAYGRRRRDGIRDSWFRWAEVGTSIHACFVVGQDLPKGRVRALASETARHRDVVWLNGTRDGRGPFVTIIKLYSWYLHLERQLRLSGVDGSGALRHVAKVDDDTFVNVPVMLAELDAMRCLPNLYYGAFAFAGYDPRTFLKCGFDMSSRGGAWRRYGCGKEGRPKGAAHPPFPFTSGALMLTSTSTMLALARSAAVAEFAERSSTSHHTDEDVALGFWLSRLHVAAFGGMRRAHEAAGGGEAHAAGRVVSYVRANQRLPNLGCFKSNWLYKPPRSDNVGVHFVKSAGGMAYVWGLLFGGAPHNATACRLMTGDSRL